MLHVKLLPKDKIIKTSERDPVNEYYLPLFGYFFRSKLEGVFKILEAKKAPDKFNSLCEIGYGSGVLFLFLSDYASRLYGIELHDKFKEVRDILQKEGIRADLLKGDLMELPVKENTFDVIVCLSLLEHLRPDMLQDALLQMKKAVRKNGFLIIGFPGENIITRTIFSLFYKDHHKNIHISNHQLIMEAIRKNFILKKTINYPWIFGNRLSLYYTCLCELYSDFKSENS